MKIKKNDNIIVIAGKDKGTTGPVIRVIPEREKVIISGVNTVKRHRRGRRSGEKGEIIEIDMPIHVSNVAFVDPESGKPTRIGYGKDNDGQKVRISKKSNKEISS